MKKKSNDSEKIKLDSEDSVSKRLEELVVEMQELSVLVAYYGGFNHGKSILARFLQLSATHILMMMKTTSDVKPVVARRTSQFVTYLMGKNKPSKSKRKGLKS